jgi:hypothetical protein
MIKFRFMPNATFMPIFAKLIDYTPWMFGYNGMVIACDFS